MFREEIKKRKKNDERFIIKAVIKVTPQSIKQEFPDK